MSVETQERPTEESESHDKKKGFFASLKAMVVADRGGSNKAPAHPGYGDLPPEIVEKRQRDAEAMAARDAQKRQNVAEIGEKHASTGETPRVQSNERNDV